MAISPADVITLKYIGAGGLAVFVIRELFKLVYFLIGKRKKEVESVYKTSSRERILTTNTNVAQIQKETHDIKPHFFEMKDQVNDIHEVITEKEKGVPLIYNKGLEVAVEKLQTNISTQAGAIKDLAGAIRDMKK